MATWTDVDSARLEPGKPIRSIDGLALRDNPIAIAEGATGAPRIQQAAMADNSVTTRAIVNGSVTSAKLAVGANETNWMLGRNAGAGAGAVGTYALLRRIALGTTNPGESLPGSQLRWSSGGAAGGGAPGGSWRCMGYATGASGGEATTLWLRYA